jgi:hypothetical protein
VQREPGWWILPIAGHLSDAVLPVLRWHAEWTNLLWLRVYGARFRQELTLEDAIEFYAFALLEALPCV